MKKNLVITFGLLIAILLAYYSVKSRQVGFDQAELFDLNNIESVKSGCQHALWGPEEQSVKQKHYEECLQQYPNAH